MEKPTAMVREVDGQLVLDDPQGLEVVRAVAKHNLKWLIEANTERVAYFKNRIKDLGKTSDDVVIVLHVDDPQAGLLADLLMPGHDWQAYRDRGEVPVARGLAGRLGIQEALDNLDPEAGEKLRKSTSVAVVAMDFGVAEVYPA